MSVRLFVPQFVLFIVMVSALWGPKIGGYLDLMVLVPSALLLFLAASGQVLVPLRFYITCSSIALLVAVWVGMSMLINGVAELQGVLRSARAFITIVILVPIVYMAASRQLVSIGTAFRLLMVTLFVNTAVIYAQVMFVPLQDVMAPVWGFDKPIRDVRAFGLTAGYDTAGYLAAFLAGSALAASLVFRSWGWFFFFIICSGAVGFTSRTSMLVLGGFVTVVLVLRKSDWRGNGARIVFTVLGGLIAFVWYVLPRVLSGVSELSGLASYDDHDYSSDYARTSLLDVLSNAVVMPQDLLTWLIGSGLIVPWSDIGYIKLLHLGGAPLLGLIFVFYCYLFWVARSSGRRLMKLEELGCVGDRWLRVWMNVSFLLLLVMIVGNVKNLYFFSRGYHELFIIVAALMLGFCKGRVVCKGAASIARGRRGCGGA